MKKDNMKYRRQSSSPLHQVQPRMNNVDTSVFWFWSLNNDILFYFILSILKWIVHSLFRSSGWKHTERTVSIRTTPGAQKHSPTHIEQFVFVVIFSFPSCLPCFWFLWMQQQGSKWPRPSPMVILHKKIAVLLVDIFYTFLEPWVRHVFYF